MAKLTKLDDIVSLCKRRGFIFQSSAIYGGLASCYDYGPLGVELKRNVRAAWWKSVVQMRDGSISCMKTADMVRIGRMGELSLIFEVIDLVFRIMPVSLFILLNQDICDHSH